MRGTRNATGENLLRWISFIDSITTFIIHHPFTLTNAKTGGISKGNNVNGTSSLNASSLLLAATARARCVFVHVAVSVRLPSPRALRRTAYIYRPVCAMKYEGDFGPPLEPLPWFYATMASLLQSIASYRDGISVLKPPTGNQLFGNFKP